MASNKELRRFYGNMPQVEIVEDSGPIAGIKFIYPQRRKIL